MEDKKGHRKQEVEEIRRAIASRTDRAGRRERGVGSGVKMAGLGRSGGFLEERGEWELGWKGKAALDARLRSFT